MRIMFHGSQSTEEAAESLLSILKLFKDRYGISQFREINLDVVLQDEEGEDVELIDASTSEILGIFEVFQNESQYKDMFPGEQPNRRRSPNLKLVVDNSKGFTTGE